MNIEDKLLKVLSNSIIADLGLLEDDFTALDHIDTNRGKTHPKRKKHNPVEAITKTGMWFEVRLNPRRYKTVEDVYDSVSENFINRHDYQITQKGNGVFFFSDFNSMEDASKMLRSYEQEGVVEKRGQKFADSGVGGFLDMWLPNTNKNIYSPDESEYTEEGTRKQKRKETNAAVATIPEGVQVKGKGGHWEELDEDIAVDIIEGNDSYATDIVAVKLPDGNMAKVYRSELIEAIKL